MAIRSIRRQSANPGGYPGTANAAPIYVDSDDNIMKIIPAGSGTTEVEVVDASSTQTLTNKTLTSPTLNTPTLATPTITNPSITSITPVNVTTATVSITAATHGGRTITLNRATGITATLPAASGSGVYFRFVVGTTFTGTANIVVANTTDVINGCAVLFADGGDTVVGFAATASDDTVNLFTASNTTGGLLGEIIELVDVASGKWHCNLVSDAGGTEVTPFSATV